MSKDRNNDRGVLSRGNFLLFLCDNDQKVKIIDHSPSSRIPLMEVNEKIYYFTLFVSSHEHQFIDKDHLTIVDSDEPPPLINRGNPDWGDFEPPLESTFFKGDTVKTSLSGAKKMYVVDDCFKNEIG